MTSVMSGAERFLRAARREPVDRVPIWLMRQAGRYLPEYRALKSRYDFLTLTREPELVTEVTLQPIRRFGFDAAILFSDIMTPVPFMGADLRFDPAPGLSEPYRSEASVARLRVPGGDEIAPFVTRSIELLKDELGGKTALIGFAGAPWTMATYLAEGASVKNFTALRVLAANAPQVARELLEKVTVTTEHYVAMQVSAGVDAMMLFDTWAGELAGDAYRTWALPFARRAVEAATNAAAAVAAPVRRDHLPVIYFMLDGGPRIEDALGTGADVLGIDWKTPLGEARRRVGRRAAVQGNLDPAALYGTTESVEAAVQRVLDEAGTAPGHIFNLGHGIWPDAPVAGVETVCDAVRRLGTRGLAHA